METYFGVISGRTAFGYTPSSSIETDDVLDDDDTDVRPRRALQIVRIGCVFVHRRCPDEQRGRGYGVIALESIPIGEIIGEYVGTMGPGHRNTDYHARRADQRRPYAAFAFPPDDDPFTIDAAVLGNVTRFMNHDGQRPNVDVTIQGHRVIFRARRDINAGDELSWRYDVDDGVRGTPLVCKFLGGLASGGPLTKQFEAVVRADVPDYPISLQWYSSIHVSGSRVRASYDESFPSHYDLPTGSMPCVKRHRLLNDDDDDDEDRSVFYFDGDDVPPAYVTVPYSDIAYRNWFIQGLGDPIRVANANLYFDDEYEQKNDHASQAAWAATIQFRKCLDLIPVAAQRPLRRRTSTCHYLSVMGIMV